MEKRLDCGLASAFAAVASSSSWASSAGTVQFSGDCCCDPGERLLRLGSTDREGRQALTGCAIGGGHEEAICGALANVDLWGGRGTYTWKAVALCRITDGLCRSDHR